VTDTPRTTPEVGDERIVPPFLAGERESLESWLEFYRATVPVQIGGLASDQLCVASVPPSNLTLLGLVRHLTAVERYWFGVVVAGRGEPAMLYSTPENRDGAFTDVDPAHAFDDLDRFHQEVAQARDHAAAVANLDAPLLGRRHGRELNLRWVYVHMIEEYARHLGHADLIRERIDGGTGY
jgi:hypothetical protein